MKGSIVSWLLLAISTISIFSEVAGASASAQCLGIDQRSLLLKLRNSLIFNASKSSKLVQWDRSADSWSGVTCKDGLVVGLDLSDESISGIIDDLSSLFKLEFLRSLNLAFNDFNYMAIPSGLMNLSRLENLNLSDARFAGQIPAELSRLRKLRTLDLSYLFNLKLEKPSLRSLIGDLGELRELYIDEVNVSTKGSEWCDALSSSVPKLEVLSMSYCSLSGPIDASLMSLANMSVIQLDGNNLSTTVPSFLANFSSLKTLSLSDCGMQGEFPQKVFQVQTIQTLDLSHNYLLQVSLPDFSEDNSLETLVISHTKILGRIPDSIGNLRKLSTLRLYNCSLSGSIPSSMKNLSELTHLDLSYNALTGRITSVGWEDLLHLKAIRLIGNSLEGDIPPALFRLPRLEIILLRRNRFNGQLIIHPNVSLDQLSVLDLKSNQLHGSIPASIFKLQQLQDLSLSYNNFSGSMNINALQRLGNLTYLDLSYNGLSINATAPTSAAASSFPKFYSLELASCQLRTVPQFLANQSNLEILDLSNNNIRGEIPRWIGTLEHLGVLNLSSNFFEDSATPPHNLNLTFAHVVDLHSNMLRGNVLPMLLQVDYLDLSRNNITYVIPDKIGDSLLSIPLFFSLSKNNIHGSIPKSICKANLKVLDLSRNHLSGTIPDCLMMASLMVLNLRDNKLSGGIPQNILPTCGLKTLDISGNLLQGQIPLSLANCATLEVVNIGDNQIDGKFPCHFRAMSTLRILILRSNKLHGEIRCPYGPSTWQKLQIVDLSSNYFSGTISTSLLTSWEAMKANANFDYLHRFVPRTGLFYQDRVIVTVKGQQLELVKILTIFTSIDFSGNRLEGPITHTLGNLNALHFLNLSHNAISGSIPSVLGNLHQLESLDLSQNYLNRTIPTQLANLNFLSFLNLSNNQLVGSIPASKQFLTFSESSFEGNLGLCGLPLNKSCSITMNRTEEVGDDRNNDDSEKKWFYLGIPLGFVFGFRVVCGPLVFVQSWRFAYYRFWDKVLFRHSRS
ncbi:receptor-like protein 7 [Eucalyptus grandis]|uniref:receptor-like protein 7 n=1 Tax=Eucalyptus grandis TaxID=71139 RepID=UPI00192EAAB2|nr:receptor-like protein 7 [Eucalyptus grandis]